MGRTYSEYDGKNEIINDVLTKCLEKIKGGMEIYLNEDDFKFSFANALRECGVDDVILEYPIFTAELYEKKPAVKDAFFRSYKVADGDKEDRYSKDRTRIDIRFRHNDTEYFVELKYKQLETEVTRYEKGFTLRDQSAQDDGMYAIHEDIERMEAIKLTKDHKECMAFCIFITNDESYMKPHNGASNKKVSLCEIIGEKKVFLSKAGVKEYGKTNNQQQNNDSQNRIHRDLIIEKRYDTSFYEFKTLTPSEKNNKFWVSVIDLQQPKTC